MVEARQADKKRKFELEKAKIEAEKEVQLKKLELIDKYNGQLKIPED